MPYCQQALVPLVKRDKEQGEGQPPLPVNIANGSINFDMGRMASGVMPGAAAQQVERIVFQYPYL